jgi:hypothetical protein
VFCLTPVSIYLLWLGMVNRRDRPTAVAGTWDLAGVLGGLSGFVVFGGALLVFFSQSNARYAARGNWEQVKSAWQREHEAWLAVAGGYLLVTGGAVGLGLIARRDCLSVYNLDRDRADAVIDEVLTGLGVNAARYGNRWSDGKPVLDIDPFYGMRHVTVRVLHPDPQFRQEFERDFRKRLATEPAPDNPVAPWFTSAAITCTMTIASSLLLMFYLTFASK